MPLSLRPISNSINLEDPEQLATLLRSIFDDLEDQLAQTAQVYVSNGIPAGVNPNDIVFGFDGKSITIGIAQSSKSLVQLTAAMIQGTPAQGLTFTGFQSIIGTPTNIPNQWGFYNQIGGGGVFFYFCDPISGLLKQVAL